MRDAAADGAAVAGHEVADVGERLAQQRMRCAGRARAPPDGPWRRCERRRSPRSTSRPARLRSTSSVGRTRRMFSAGTRLWPPAIGFASSPPSCERRQRLLERVRGDVLEGGGLHAGSPSCRSSQTRGGVSGSSTSSRPIASATAFAMHDGRAHRVPLADALGAERRHGRRSTRRGRSAARGCRARSARGSRRATRSSGCPTRRRRGARSSAAATPWAKPPSTCPSASSGLSSRPASWTVT